MDLQTIQSSVETPSERSADLVFTGTAVFVAHGQ